MSRKRCKRQVRALDNPVQLAMAAAARLTAQEVQALLAPARDAATRMREGRASSDDWAALVGAVSLARAIEAQGVVRGLAEHLAGIDAALVAIEKRASSNTPPGADAAEHWRAPTLYAHEIEALALLLQLHEFQLQQLSFGEWRSALRLTFDRIRSTPGKQVVVVDVAGRACAGLPKERAA